eukprot:m.334257 g.334257  ORF g.334257 m.334257 type:complete len:304 (-) comp17320_c0_seq1:63-974(-)
MAFASFVEEVLKHTTPVFGVPAEYSDPVMEAGNKAFDWFHPEIGNDSPTKSWPLARLDDALVILGGYLVFVLIGCLIKPSNPTKKPAAAKKLSVAQKFAAEFPVLVLMCIYNAAQVALCGWMIWATVEEYKKEGYKLICNPFNKTASGMATVLYVFYVSKVFDYCDTVFIVLRGKWEQFSFLHIYHHASIFLFYWLNINIGYDGDIYLTIILNGAVHLVMYFYYLLTTFNVPVPKPIKMMITNMQMIQFLCMNAQAIYILVNGCPYPPRVTVFYLVYIISLFILFNNFKKRAYKPDASKKKKQ